MWYCYSMDKIAKSESPTKIMKFLNTKESRPAYIKHVLCLNILLIVELMKTGFKQLALLWIYTTILIIKQQTIYVAHSVILLQVMDLPQIWLFQL
ncbi:hypothetical protein CVT25_000968 [Psilocybe cyanescens]|uniref:Uncharacterized protein n=1 Tax=Psilocybe cyanescens TaxID=93625 RepID=A0A409XS18_PSICY|nr:hypothetical protein CVT25_000968 [Psilocybe cyanescens]